MCKTTMEEHLERLVGGTITGIALDDFDGTIQEYGDVLYGLLVTMPNGDKLQATILQDAEGNGAGHLDIMKL